METKGEKMNWVMWFVTCMALSFGCVSVEEENGNTQGSEEESGGTVTDHQEATEGTTQEDDTGSTMETDDSVQDVDVDTGYLPGVVLQQSDGAWVFDLLVNGEDHYTWTQPCFIHPYERLSTGVYRVEVMPPLEMWPHSIAVTVDLNEYSAYDFDVGGYDDMVGQAWLSPYEDGDLVVFDAYGDDTWIMLSFRNENGNMVTWDGELLDLHEPNCQDIDTGYVCPDYGDDDDTSDSQDTDEETCEPWVPEPGDTYWKVEAWRGEEYMGEEYHGCSWSPWYNSSGESYAAMIHFMGWNYYGLTFTMNTHEFVFGFVDDQYALCSECDNESCMFEADIQPGDEEDCTDNVGRCQPLVSAHLDVDTRDGVTVYSFSGETGDERTFRLRLETNHMDPLCVSGSYPNMWDKPYCSDMCE